MKKTLLIVVSLLVTLFSYSQNIERVVKCSKLIFINDEWKVESTNYPKDLFIVTKDWDIKIGNVKFKTYDAPEKNLYETHLVYTWKCIDQDGVKCTFMMKKFKPEITTNIIYMVIYDDGTSYEYEIEEN